MIGGVIFPNHGEKAVWAGQSSLDFPVTNLSDLNEPRRLWRPGLNQVAISFTLPAEVLVQALAVVHHNAGPNATLGVTLNSNGGATTYQTAAAPFWPGGSARTAGLPAVRPLVLGAGVAVRSGTITFGANDQAWEVGGIDIGAWWPWPDIQVDESRGTEPSTLMTEQNGGTIETTRQWSPRVMAGRRGRVPRAELESTGLDFQRDRNTTRPFTFVRDVDNAARWPRECFLARNRDLPASAIDEGDGGYFSYSLIEHLG